VLHVDVETRGLQWYGRPDHLFSVQIGDEHDGNDVLYRHPEQRAEIQARLDSDPDKAAWNSKFDWAALDAAGYDVAFSDDGMVMAHILNENRSLALKSIAAQMFGESARDHEKAVKDWLAAERKARREASKASGDEFIYPNYSDVPDDIMDLYAMEDIVLTRAVIERYEKLLRDTPSLGNVYRMEMEVMAALFAIEKRGFPVDQENAYRFENELAQSLEAIEEECIALAGIPHFNANSPKQIIEALERRGADLTFAVKTKTGYSTNEESLEAIDDPLAAAILRFRGEYKTLGTYVKPLLHPHLNKKLHMVMAPFIASDGCVHPNFRQVGARNGRMSCADPNVQNWPRDDLRLRYLMNAGPGRKLVTCDLDNIELHLFAAFAGDGPLLDAVREGRDAHAMTAASLGLTERKRATGVESKRDRGKRFNYSVLYGAGLRSIRRTFRVNQNEARTLLDRFHAAYPEVGRLQRQIESRLHDRGYVQTYTGRRMRVKTRDAFKAPNYLIAGTAAEMLKEATIALHKAGVPLIACVHDELIARVDEKDAPEVAHLMEKAMCEFPHITEKVPVTAEAKIVDRWSQAKKRDWKPSYVQRDRATLGG
jgi:DNA polymerase I